MTDVIFYSDGGADDVALLLVLLSRDDINLKGIISNFGNISAEDAADVMGQILTLTNRTDVPVYVGYGKALNPEWHPLGDGAYDSADGINNGVKFDNTVEVKSFGATRFIVSTLNDAHRSDKKISILVSSPHSHLADAMDMMNEDQINAIGAIYSMGGCMSSVPRLKKFDFDSKLANVVIPQSDDAYEQVHGNITPWAEFNVYMDPEAWGSVMQIAKKHNIPTTIAGLDSVNGSELRAEGSGMLMTPARLKTIEDSIPHGKDIAKLLSAAAELDVRKLGSDGAMVYDPIIGLACVSPYGFDYDYVGKVNVVLDGDERGKTYVSDHAKGCFKLIKHNPDHQRGLFGSFVTSMRCAFK